MPTWTPPASQHSVLARTVAAYGLRGSALRFPEEPLAATAFEGLVAAVRTQRLTGPLWAAVRDGALPVTDAQRDRLEWMHVEALAGVLALEHLLLETTGALESAGVAVRVLKGPALAHLDYPDPGWRTFGDVDLMVQGGDFDRAVEVLVARGHRRRHPEPRPGFDRRFSKGTSFVTEDGLELDLHRTFTMGPFGVRLAVNALWESSSPFRLAGTMLRALPAEERFLHACYHAVLGDASPRLVPLRDIVQLGLGRDLDLARLQMLVRQSGGAVVVSRAIRGAWHALEIADVLAITAWAEAYRTNPQDAADMAVYEAGSNYARKSVASVRALPWRDRIAYVRALAVPTRSYLGVRHPGRLERLRTGVGQTRSGHRP